MPSKSKKDSPSDFYAGAEVIDSALNLSDDSDTKDDIQIETASTQKKYKIIIERQDNEEGNLDVAIGVNGRTYLIKRGFVVEVPEEVVEVLRNAVQSKFMRNEAGEEVLIDMPRFVWRIVS